MILQSQPHQNAGTVFVNGHTWKKEGLPSARIMELLFPDILKDKYDGTKELPEILQLYFKHIQTLLDSGTHSLERLRDNIDQIAAQVEKQWLRRYVRFTASNTFAHVVNEQSEKAPCIRGASCASCEGAYN